MRRHDSPRNGQAQSRPSRRVRPRAVTSVKPVEDVFKIGLGNADARVSHGQERRTVFGAAANPDDAMLAVESNGIAQEVYDHLADTLWIGVGFRARQVAFDGDATFAGQRPHAFDRRSSRFRKVAKMALENFLPGVEPRQL